MLCLFKAVTCLLMTFFSPGLTCPFLCLNKFSLETTYACSDHYFLKGLNILFSWNHTLHLIIRWNISCGLLDKTINADNELAFPCITHSNACRTVCIKSLLEISMVYMCKMCEKHGNLCCIRNTPDTGERKFYVI